jgi:hypothetical protein
VQRGSAALCQIRPQLLLSGQYFEAHTAYSLCRDARARGQRERGSVSNKPPAALVRSVLCSGAPTPSAEMRGQGGRGSARGSVSNKPTAALIRAVLRRGVLTLSAEVLGQGGRGLVSLCQIRPQLLLSG